MIPEQKKGVLTSRSSVRERKWTGLWKCYLAISTAPEEYALLGRAISLITCNAKGGEQNMGHPKRRTQKGDGICPGENLSAEGERTASEYLVKIHQLRKWDVR